MAVGRRFLVLARGLVERIPALLVWAGLVGLGVYGAKHGWKFGDDPPPKEKAEAPADAKKPDDDFELRFEARPHDVPVLVAHDPARCEATKKPVRLSAGAAEKVGVRTATVGRRPMPQVVSAHGEVVQDPVAVARVAPRVGGVIVRFTKQLGEPVRRGELLALVDSADVGKAKAALITARAQREARQRVRDALQSGVAPERSIVEADAALREARAAEYAARQGIANLGLPLPAAADESLPDDAFARRLQALGVPDGTTVGTGFETSANLLPVFSPLDGAVMKRAGVDGETVAALQTIYEVGDPQKVDVFLDVRQEDMPDVKAGQKVAFRLEGAPLTEPFAGVIDWLSPAVDEKTRTVRVRARGKNPGGVLRSGAFGHGTVRVNDTDEAVLAVPAGAVHWEGCSHVVFVKRPADDTPGHDAGDRDDGEAYWPTRVALGVRQNGYVQVTGGLQGGEEVAVAGSHVLKSELLKDRIGGGEE